MSHSYAHFTGDNYEDVLAAIPSYVRCSKHNLELHVYIPFKGDLVIKKNCYILKVNNDIQIIYD